MGRRVVITGLGTVTALGVGHAPLWEGLLAGKTGIARITRFDPSGCPMRLGGEVRGVSGSADDFSAKDYVPKSYRKAVKVMARDTELAVAAAKLAVEDAGLATRGTIAEPTDATTYASERVGCHIGAGLIAAETEELTSALVTAVGEGEELRRRTNGFDIRRWGAAPDMPGSAGGMNNLQPLWMLKYLPNMLACHVTIIHGAEGPSNTLTCAEASGLLSLGESTRVIQRGAAEACFSGGAESKVNLMGVLRLDLAGRLAHTEDDVDPLDVLRPYDPMSRGGIVGEAGGILIVEERDAARARGARAYAEIAGFGAAQSALFGAAGLSHAAPSGAGIEAAILASLDDAKLTPGDIDAIVPHATGVKELDDAERSALRAVFADRLMNIPAVTLAPSLGDCWAGNGGVHAAVAALCLAKQMLPARLHASAPVGVNAGPAPATPAHLRHVLVCTDALGGQNAAIVLSAAT